MVFVEGIRVSDRGNVDNIGVDLIRWSVSAILSSASLISSPDSRVTVRDDSGFVNIDMISKGACFENRWL